MLLWLCAFVFWLCYMTGVLHFFFPTSLFAPSLNKLFFFLGTSEREVDGGIPTVLHFLQPNRIKRKRDTAIQRISFPSSPSEWFCYRKARRCRKRSPSRPARRAPSCWWPLSHTAAARPPSPGASTKSLSQLTDCEEAGHHSTYRNGDKNRKVWLFSAARFYFLTISLTCHMLRVIFKPLDCAVSRALCAELICSYGREVAALVRLSCLFISVVVRSEKSK